MNICSHPPSGRAPLRISLLGGVDLSIAGTSERLPRSVQALLGYLVVHRQRSHPREVLATVFWGDQPSDSARRCLNTTLWRLRRILEPAGVARGTYLLTTASGDVAFNRDAPYWLDVAELEAQAECIKHTDGAHPLDDEVRALEAAVGLYGGEALEGLYDDWALRERERLRLLFLDSLAFLVRHHRSHGNHPRVIEWARRLLELDPLREEIHRELMRAYAASGQRACALRQFDVCRAALAAELDIEPMAETCAVQAEILGAVDRVVPRGTTPHLTPSLAVFSQALDQLEHALAAIRSALHAIGGNDPTNSGQRPLN